MEYFWVKAIHIMSFTSWFAMLFYLPRLFVYHAENRDKPDFTAVCKIQQEKLYKFIGVPSFWATIITGTALLLLNPSLLQNGWIHAKITLIILLSGFHFHTNVMRKSLLEDQCDKSGRWFRFYNEIPTIFLILIVILAVMKPF